MSITNVASTKERQGSQCARTFLLDMEDHGVRPDGGCYQVPSVAFCVVLEYGTEKTVPAYAHLCISDMIHRYRP
jgi:hypothetical protein